jgi:hypothetical protein
MGVGMNYTPISGLLLYEKRCRRISEEGFNVPSNIFPLKSVTTTISSSSRPLLTPLGVIYTLSPFLKKDFLHMHLL